jgi:hypothetical protein
MPIRTPLAWPNLKVEDTPCFGTLHVLAYNLTRVMNILGVKLLIAAIQT